MTLLIILPQFARRTTSALRPTFPATKAITGVFPVRDSTRVGCSSKMGVQIRTSLTASLMECPWHERRLAAYRRPASNWQPHRCSRQNLLCLSSPFLGVDDHLQPKDGNLLKRYVFHSLQPAHPHNDRATAQSNANSRRSPDAPRR